MNANGTVGDWNLVTFNFENGKANPTPWTMITPEGNEDLQIGAYLVSFSTDENNDPILVLFGEKMEQLARFTGTLKMMDEGVFEIEQTEVFVEGNETLTTMARSIVGWCVAVYSGRGGDKYITINHSEAEGFSFQVDGF